MTGSNVPNRTSNALNTLPSRRIVRTQAGEAHVVTDVSQLDLLGSVVVAEPGQRRKLSAILSVDVVGYSRLMADGESATAATLKE